MQMSTLIKVITNSAIFSLLFPFMSSSSSLHCCCVLCSTLSSLYCLTQSRSCLKHVLLSFLVSRHTDTHSHTHTQTPIIFLFRHFRQILYFSRSSLDVNHQNSFVILHFILSSAEKMNSPKHTSIN